MMTKAEEILENFEVLKKFLRNRAICRDDEIVICDPPITIRILKKEEMIVFSCNDEDVAIISRDKCKIDKGFEGVVEEWCTALTTLGFKRYILKRI
jgi:hypothetical protein